MMVHASSMIVGFGLVTPLGFSALETWSALMEGRFIRDHARVKLPSPQHEDRATATAIHAAREAIAQAGWTQPVLSSDDTALVVATSKGPVESWIGSPVTRASSPCRFGLGGIATWLAESIGLGRGARLTLSAACASGLHALIRAAMLIRSGEASRVLVVATEASVHPLFLGSFKRLGVLPPEGHGCRPFDETRNGFLMSESAAAVCLAPSPQGERGPCRIAIDAFALGGDATHLTGGDPEGRTLRHLLERAIGDRPIDLVHAHATGTRLNDPVELAAIESVIGPRWSPHIYSHKGALGHSLGAAGMVSVVLNCLMHQRGVIPPNVRTTCPISSRMPIAPHAVERPIRRSLTIAAGFGGPTAVISLANLTAR
jgi:3-oxoacyl-[acyl-carrier-protein] synthase II